MKFNLIFISLILILFSCETGKNTKSIQGSWNFYSKQFIKSNRNNIKDVSNTKVFVSGSENNKNSIKFDYGTITKKINVIQGKEYALYISGINSSSKIWINDENIINNGVIGSDLYSSKPRIQRNILNFFPNSDSVTISIEFSNLYLNENFIFRWMLIGESLEITNLYLKDRSIYFGTIGFSIMTFIIFLMIFAVNRQDKYYFYFAFFSLSYCIRSLFMEHGIILYFTDDFPWILEYQITKAAEVFSLFFFILFFKNLYSSIFNKKIFNIVAFVSILWIPSCFIPLHIFSNYGILNYIHYWILLGGIFILVNLFRAILKSEKNSILAFISILLFYGSIIFDILATSKLMNFSYISGQAFFFVVVSIFVMVGRKMLETTNFLIESQVTDFKLKEVFSRFVPVEILGRLNNKELLDREPGDSCIELLTMVYIDIRDFTNLSEGLSAKENFKLINDFYEIVSSNIQNFGGFIESYGGDGVKAFFDNEPNFAVNACNEIRREVRSLDNIKIGISINLGRVVLGTIGCNIRQQATAVSEETRLLGKMDNFLSRMKIDMIVTEKVYTLSSIDREYVMCLGDIYLNDEYDPKTLYQVFCKDEEIDYYFVAAFENGIKLIKQKKYVKAYSNFLLAQMYNPNHILTSYYVSELKKHMVLRDLTFKLKV